MRDGEERHRLEAAAASAEEEARRWDAIARRIDGIGDEARPLLADVVEAWTPDVLDGEAAARGWHALLRRREVLQQAVRDLEDDAAEARRRAERARADAVAAHRELARLAVAG